MDWDQEQAAPKAYVGGPAKIRVVENGPARVAVEVSRETAGSRFVQTIRLSAGDAGKRVEFGNVIDWNTKESNLKATFPLTASNEMATYNWDIGTIERPTREPKKFEVPSHQWIDLTDMSGEFGATILTDCKNGSDKPNDHTIRLTLIRTPGTRGGYADQGTQDIGHHEFVYGIAGHAADWRQGQTDWQAQRLNDPLIAFETSKHAGALGREFSLLKVSNPRIRVLALKKAEQSDEIDRAPGGTRWQAAARCSSLIPRADHRRARSERAGAARGTGDRERRRAGDIVLGLSAAHIRGAFGCAADQGSQQCIPRRWRCTMTSRPPATTARTLSADSTARAMRCRRRCCRRRSRSTMCNSNSLRRRPAHPTRWSRRDRRSICLRASTTASMFWRLRRKAIRRRRSTVGGKKIELNIQDWGGFIGQWDDRQWSSGDTSNDNYGKMIGLTPAYIKRADLAWYCSHHHNAAGENVSYGYSYLFAYPIDLPAGAKTINCRTTTRSAFSRCRWPRRIRR